MCHPPSVTEPTGTTPQPAGDALPPADVGVVVQGADERLAKRMDAIRAVIAVLLGMLGLTALMSLSEEANALHALLAADVVALVFSLVLHYQTGIAQRQRLRDRETSMTRILQGLSRSVSPESVVDAIVQELRTIAAIDHVVVARVRQPDQVVEVTLVASSPTVPISRTWLRPDVGELSTDHPATSVTASDQARPPAGGADTPAPAASTTLAPLAPPGREARLAFQSAAEEVARRVRSAYGLSYTLAEPLVAERRFLGALVLSKRTRDAWGDADRRLLEWAAGEVAAAFARAYVLAKAERGANIDALTGLPNRRYFDELLAIMRPRRRTTDSLGVMMVDIDLFKKVNDRYGHAVGDEVLRAVAGAVEATVRAEDTPARYGGEEFVVILRRASAAQATEVAERVRQAVAALPPERLGTESGVTVSVGVAVAAPGEDIAVVIERADRALFVAKRGGRDRVEAG